MPLGCSSYRWHTPRKRELQLLDEKLYLVEDCALSKFLTRLEKAREAPAVRSFRILHQSKWQGQPKGAANQSNQTDKSHFEFEYIFWEQM